MVFQFWINQRTRHLTGVYHRPTGNKSQVAVLLIAGFSQPMCDIDYFMSRLARFLSSRGIHAFQLDPYGAGDSSGLLEEITCSTLTNSLLMGIHYIKKQGFSTVFCISRGLPAYIFSEISRSLSCNISVIGLNPYIGSPHLDSALLTEEYYELFDLYKTFPLKYVNLFLEDIGAKPSNLRGQKVSSVLLREVLSVHFNINTVYEYYSYCIWKPLCKTNYLNEHPSFQRDADWQNGIIHDICNYVLKDSGDKV